MGASKRYGQSVVDLDYSENMPGRRQDLFEAVAVGVGPSVTLRTGWWERT
jgi:hypothetical protein